MIPMREPEQQPLRNWQPLVDMLQTGKRFVFSTHQEPDADGFGSELALARYLTQKGKEVSILNPTELRSNLHFLAEPEEYQQYQEDVHHQTLLDCDVFIAFDIGAYERLEPLLETLEASPCKKVSIDHHPGEKGPFDWQLNDTGASSTGVLIFDLLQGLDRNLEITLALALPLYAAIMSDTGNFRFNNTDVETLTAATELLRAGVKPYQMYVELYENLNTPGRIEVLRHILATLRFAEQGRLAWATLDFNELAPKGVKTDDLHNLSDFIRSIQGVEIGFVLIKMDGAPVDVSLRSKGKFPVNGVATHFGGGGHANAAGCRIAGSLEQAESQLAQAFQVVLAGGILD